MAGGRVLAICRSGGGFVANGDGSMTYSGGEAHALEITCEMKLTDFKSEVSGLFKTSPSTFNIKYFLPNNRKTLITVSTDKDFHRMIDFNAAMCTTDVYLLKKSDDRKIRSIVVDAGTPTDDATATPVTAEDAKRRKLCAAGWECMLTGEGQTFDSPKLFRDALHRYAIANSFSYKFVKNDGARVTAKCSSERCPWRVHASRSSGNQGFTVRKLNGTHTCRREISKAGHRLASQRWVASVIKDKLRDSPNYKPRDIANDLQQEYGLVLNYAQAWRGKFVATKELHNSHEEACSQLPWYCERIMETNPGSMATVQATDDSKFHLFVAFHASLSGFEHGCRPLIFLDSLTPKASKQWKLLVASAVDGENNSFPVSFSVADAETKESWHWFLVQLKSAFTMSRTITFVSNKQNGLEEAVTEVFENSCHGYCVARLIDDFRAKLHESWNQELKDSLLDTFERSIYAFKVEDFNEYINIIRSKSEELAEWIVGSKPENWSNAFFRGLRLGCYSSDSVETFNSWASTKYEPSVVQMVDIIRCKMMEMMHTRRASSTTWTERLTPTMHRRVEEELHKARDLNVGIHSSGNLFEVQDDAINVVNIETFECTCKKWQVTGLPCAHALAVLEQIDARVYDYCSKYLTTECFHLTYNLPINPIPDAGRPASMDLGLDLGPRPPRTRRMVGRPKLKPAADPRITIKRGVRCSKCQEYGHNKQSCKAST